MKKTFLLLCLWMGTSLPLSAQNFSMGQTGQQTRKKIAVYVSSILSDERNTALADNLMEAFAESEEYIAVNRSREVYDLMKKAQSIQQNGHIDINQVANFTKQFGEDQLCAVSVIKIDKTFVFRATIVELATGVIIKSASHEYNHYSNDTNIPYEAIYKASKNIIEKLLGKPKQAAEPTSAPKPAQKKSNYHSDIAWGIAGAGYPWNLVSSIEWRWGGIIGLGLYGDIGMDFTHCGKKYGDPITATHFRYAGGLKFYPYRGIFLDCGYGTICPAKAESKDFDSSHGVLFHAGYNLFLTSSGSTGFFLGVSGGASYDVKNMVYAPSINLKIGIAWER